MPALYAGSPMQRVSVQQTDMKAPRRRPVSPSAPLLRQDPAPFSDSNELRRMGMHQRLAAPGHMPYGACAAHRNLLDARQAARVDRPQHLQRVRVHLRRHAAWPDRHEHHKCLQDLPPDAYGSAACVQRCRKRSQSFLVASPAASSSHSTQRRPRLPGNG